MKVYDTMPSKPDFGKDFDYLDWMNKLLLENNNFSTPDNLTVELWQKMDDEFPGWQVISKLEEYAKGGRWEKVNDREVAECIDVWQKNINVFKQTIKQDNFPIIGLVAGEGFGDLDVARSLFFSECSFPYLSHMNWFAYIILADINAIDNYSNKAKKLDAWRDVLGYCYRLEQSNIYRAIKDSYSLRSVVYKSIKDSIDDNILQKDDLDEVKNILRYYPVGPYDFSVILAGEWAMDYCFLQLVYDSKGRINNKIISKISFLDGRDLEQNLLVAGLKPEEITDYVEEYYTEWLNIISKPDFKAGSAYVSLRPELANHPLNGLMYARFDLLLRDNQQQNKEYVAMLELINSRMK